MAFDKNEYLVQDDITHRYKRISEHTVGDSLTGTVQENKQVFDDYPDLISEKHNGLINNFESVVASSVTEAVLKTALLNTFYPVGSYYETSKTVAQFDPNTAWGGTWELESSGKVHVSAGDGYTVGATGGSKDAIIPQHNHTFTGTAVDGHKHSVSASTNSTGAHTHTVSGTISSTTPSITASCAVGGEHNHASNITGLLGYKVNGSFTRNLVQTTSSGNKYVFAASDTGDMYYITYLSSEGTRHSHSITLSGGSHSHTFSSGSAGSNGGHSHTVTVSETKAGGFTPAGTISETGTSVTNANMQPYIVVNRWHRTA